jgi:maleylpyruvate isomerase
MAVADEIESLHHSDQRAVRTVDSLTDEQWAGPSILPGWTRAHVVAHLALNGEGFSGALEGLLEGHVVPIYPSNASRDAAIETLARAPYGEIRRRFFAATAHFRSVATRLSSRHWEATVTRLPDGPVWPAVDLVGARQREVEIHHVDLDAGYAYTDWPDDFACQLLDQVSGDHADSPDSPAFAVRATDLGTTRPLPWAGG